MAHSETFSLNDNKIVNIYITKNNFVYQCLSGVVKFWEIFIKIMWALTNTLYNFCALCQNQFLYITINRYIIFYILHHSEYIDISVSSLTK